VVVAVWLAVHTKFDVKRPTPSTTQSINQPIKQSINQAIAPTQNPTQSFNHPTKPPHHTTPHHTRRAGHHHALKEVDALGVVVPHIAQVPYPRMQPPPLPPQSPAQRALLLVPIYTCVYVWVLSVVICVVGKRACIGWCDMTCANPTGYRIGTVNPIQSNPIQSNRILRERERG
jgi:hypothetical protein